MTYNSAGLRITHRNPSPRIPKVEYEDRTVSRYELCSALARFEDEGWQVHTVTSKYNPIQGETFWVLLRRENGSRNVFA